MKLALKKILANILVLMVIMLPLRAMAMPIDMSPEHCMGGDMMTEMSDSMSMVQSSDLEMPSINDVDEQASCECCKQCSDCTNMTAVSFDLLQLSNTRSHENYAVTAELLFTSTITPPSRPPQILYN